MVEKGAWYCDLIKKIEIDTENVSVEDHDSDILTISTTVNDDIKKYKVRIRAIDAPEHSTVHKGAQVQAYHKQSHDLLKNIVEDVKTNNNTLCLHIRSDEPIDSQERILAKITYSKETACEDRRNNKNNSIDIGLEMISKGAAWHFKRYKWEQSESDRNCYAYAQKYAQGLLSKNEFEDSKNLDIAGTKINCGLPEFKDNNLPLGLWVQSENIQAPWNWKMANLDKYERYDINPYLPRKDEETTKNRSGGKTPTESNLDSFFAAPDSKNKTAKSSSWEAAILIGLTDAISDLAEENMIDWFVTEVLEDLCDAKSMQYFPNICKFRTNNEDVILRSKTMLRNAIQRDINDLPAVIATKLFQRDNRYQVAHWVYILGGLINNVRKGGDATYLIAGLADDPQVRGFCRDENRHACSLVLSGAIMQAYIAVPFYETKKYPRWQSWQVAFLEKLEDKIKNELYEVFGSCTTQDSACLHLLARIKALKTKGELGLSPYFKLRRFVDTIKIETTQLAEIESRPENLAIIYQKAFIISDNTLKAIRVVNGLFGSELTCNQTKNPLKFCKSKQILADLRDSKFTRTTQAIAGFFSGNYSQGYIELLAAIEEYEKIVDKQSKGKKDKYFRWPEKLRTDTEKFYLEQESYKKLAYLYDSTFISTDNGAEITCTKITDENAVDKKVLYLLKKSTNEHNCLVSDVSKEITALCEEQAPGEKNDRTKYLVSKLCSPSSELIDQEKLNSFGKNLKDTNYAANILRKYISDIKGEDLDTEVVYDAGNEPAPINADCTDIIANRDASKFAENIFNKLNEYNSCLNQWGEVDKLKAVCTSYKVENDGSSKLIMQRICTAYYNWEKVGSDNLNSLKTRIPFLI
ncbi:MAG: thermonuclease family protein, partial [Thiohalomonadales bacterium]